MVKRELSKSENGKKGNSAKMKMVKKREFSKNESSKKKGNSAKMKMVKKGIQQKWKW